MNSLLNGRLRVGVLVALTALAGLAGIANSADPPKMRPYSGIGLIVLPAAQPEIPPPDGPYLYEEPGILRIAPLASAVVTGNQWIFKDMNGQQVLLVMARQGDWLRVSYDDAGREGWFKPALRGVFQPWELYLKGAVSHLLPGLRSQYYQLFRLPGQDLLATVSPQQPLRVLRLDNDWAQVLADQATVGWLRWRDEDSRLTVGL